jgi:drug/metabolite transporter (DMT)-like permease
MLTEVLFAVAFAWLMLGELPRLVQLGGGVLIVAGVVAVRLDEVRGARPSPAADGEIEADFAVPTPVP